MREKDIRKKLKSESRKSIHKKSDGEKKEKQKPHHVDEMNKKSTENCINIELSSFF